MRIRLLDGLRGIAAFVVVLSHVADTFPQFYLPHPSYASTAFWTDFFAILKYTPMRIFVSGRASVMLFFALSGFVLYLSHRPGVSYMSYLAKRLFRIVPPFAFAILLAAVLDIAVDPHWVDQASQHFNDANWTETPTPSYLASNLLMSGIPEFPTLNNPTWSLVHELRISVIFPLLVIGLAYSFWGTVIVAAVVSTLALALPLADPVAYTVELTVGYTVFFVAGAALAMSVDRVRAVLVALPREIVALLWLVTWMLIICPMQRDLDSLAPGVGAVLLIALCISSSLASRLLESTVARWLGRVSYSLYLVHIPILLTVVHLGAGHVSLGLLCLAAVLISLVSAEFCYRIVEHPSMMIGRKVARRLELVQPRAMASE
jgi:peptidoglycan/LPS O-acetylase OafA/YrhL